MLRCTSIEQTVCTWRLCFSIISFVWDVLPYCWASPGILCFEGTCCLQDPLTQWCSITSQKTRIWNVATMKTSELTDNGSSVMWHHNLAGGWHHFGTPCASLHGVTSWHLLLWEHHVSIVHGHLGSCTYSCVWCLGVRCGVCVYCVYTNCSSTVDFAVLILNECTFLCDWCIVEVSSVVVLAVNSLWLTCRCL